MGFGKKKTAFVWVLLAFIVIEFLVVTKEVIGILRGNISSSNVVWDTVTYLIGFVLAAILFVKLYNVRPDVIKWLHIYFVYIILINLIEIILTALAIGISEPEVILNALMIIIPIFMWIGIYKHLRRAQREKLMNFS